MKILGLLSMMKNPCCCVPLCVEKLFCMLCDQRLSQSKNEKTGASQNLVVDGKLPSLLNVGRQKPCLCLSNSVMLKNTLKGVPGCSVG